MERFIPLAMLAAAVLAAILAVVISPRCEHIANDVVQKRISVGGMLLAGCVR